MTFKIACCISGYPTPRILDHLNYLVKYKNVMDFFIFFWDVIGVDLKNRINNLIQPKEIVYCNPIRFPFDATFKEPDKNDNKNDALSMFYGISQVQSIRNSYSIKNKINYDLIIRFRFDLHFISDFEKVLQDVKNNLTNNVIIFPFEHNHIGICDQLWFGTCNEMNKFMNLFQWIKDNIKTLLFINENVLYQFIINNNIQFKCLDIQYILRRSGLMDYTQHEMISEYNKQRQLPWVTCCPERIEGKYQKYMLNKNKSANAIYFLTNCRYQRVMKNMFNIAHDKFMYVNKRNAKYNFIGSVNSTTFILQLFDVSTIVIAINESDKQLFMAYKDKQLTFIDDPNNPTAHFHLSKTDNDFIITHYARNCKNTNTYDTLYLSMNATLSINLSESLLRDSHWLFS